MKRAVTLLMITVVATVIITALFGVIVCAPEPWQDRPWTIWERCAQVLFLILGWPITLGVLLLLSIAKDLPDPVAKPIIFFLFVAAGAFWAGMIDLTWRKWKRTPNQASQVTARKLAEPER